MIDYIRWKWEHACYWLHCKIGWKYPHAIDGRMIERWPRIQGWLARQIPYDSW